MNGDTISLDTLEAALDASLPGTGKLSSIPTGGIAPGRALGYFGSVCHATNERIFAEVKERLMEDPDGDLYLTVTSSGGPSGLAMCFYDTLRRILKPRLTTIGTGDVDSSGIIIFLAGTRRIVSARTTLLLHPAGRRFDPDTRFTAAEIEAMAREDRLKDRQYAGVVAENARRLSPEDVLGMMERHTVLDPSELKSLGLAHEILH